MSYRSYKPREREVSRDVYYQTMNIYHNHPVQLDPSQTTINLPIPRSSYLPKGMQLLIEIISLDWKVFDAAPYDHGVIVSLTSSNPSNLGTEELLSAHSVISRHVSGEHLYNELAATTYIQKINHSEHVDLTDGMGHGYLIAVDKLYLRVEHYKWDTFDPMPIAHPIRAALSIKYRWRVVPVSEFVGIVQSQLDSTS